MKSNQHQVSGGNSCLITVPRKPSVAGLATLTATCAALLLLGSSAKADQGNQLVNPGFETGNNGGWTTQGNCNTHKATDTYYNAGMCPPDATAANVNVYDGTYVGNMYGTFSAAVSYTYYQQTLPTVAGSTWSASCWAYASHEDLLGQNSFRVVVDFLDSTSTVISEYQSFSVTNLSCAGPNVFPLDTWVQLAVTNQFNASGTQTGTIPNGVMTAPAGTASVRYQLLFENVNYAGGSIFLDDAVLDLISGPLPPVVSTIIPNNMIMINSNSLSFNITSASGTITNAEVDAFTAGLPGTDITNSIVYKVGSPGFSVIGLGSNAAYVTLTLQSNTLYNIVAKGTDNNGVTATATAFFDTIQPTYLWEAEDFNYSSGQWVQTITANGGMLNYSNLVGTMNIDEYDANPGNGPHDYRPNDSVSVQPANEVTPGGLPLYRQKFVDFYAANPGASNDINLADEEIGYNNAGDWVDYTRNFPAGKYNVYARLATSGGGAQSYFEQVLSDPTQPSQTVTNYGTFSLSDNNWNYYEYCPLLDSYGNLVPVTLGGTQTVRIQIATGGNPNENFYFIVPAVAPQTPVLQSTYPDGVHPFEATNNFQFTVSQGSGSAIPSGNVHLTLNGSDVTSLVTFTSTSTNWTGVVPVLSNAVYNAVINVTNSTHLSKSYAVSFDTFTQSNYMFEAEDFDFNGGSYIDNPVPTGDSTITGNVAGGTLAADSYYGEPGGTGASVVDVDYVSTESGQSQQYRLYDAPGTQVAGDFLRDKFLAAQTALTDPLICDFNIGWYSTGTWLNYTRHYPNGNYNVWGRMAGGAGAFTGTTLSVVTSGWGTTLQTSNVLGTFSDPNAGGWQDWRWVPLEDTNGNLVTIPITGSTNTLKLASGNNLNVNYLMLVPAVATASPVQLNAILSAGNVNISFPTQNGHTYTVQYTASLSPPVTWSTLTTITGNGSTQSAPDPTTATVRYYRVMVQ